MVKRIAMFAAFALLFSCLVACDGTASGEDMGKNANATEQYENNTFEGSLFEEEVTLRYVIPDVFGDYPGWENILSEINKITKNRINALVEVEFIPIGEYSDKMNMKFVSGEEFDVCFSGAWNPYTSAVAINAYAELTDEMLATYAPNVVRDLDQAVWDAITIDGKIYGVPLQQVYVRQTGVRVATELADRYDFDPSTIVSLDDLDKYAETIKSKEPDAIPIFVSKSNLYENMINYMGFDCLVSSNVPGAVYFAGDTTVVNQFETEEFRNLCQKVREWNLAGYLPADAVFGAHSAQGKVYAIAFDPAHKPGGDITESQARGYYTRVFPLAAAQ